MRYVDKGSHSAKNLSGTCSLYPSIGSQLKSPGSGFDDKKPESNLINLSLQALIFLIQYLKI